jgi:hypothetical protein
MRGDDCLEGRIADRCGDVVDDRTCDRVDVGEALVEVALVEAGVAAQSLHGDGPPLVATHHLQCGLQ